MLQLVLSWTRTNFDLIQRNRHICYFHDWFLMLSVPSCEDLWLSHWRSSHIPFLNQKHGVLVISASPNTSHSESVVLHLVRRMHVVCIFLTSSAKMRVIVATSSATPALKVGESSLSALLSRLTESFIMLKNKVSEPIGSLVSLASISFIILRRGRSRGLWGINWQLFDHDSR